MLRDVEGEGLDARWVAELARDYLRDDPLPPEEKCDTIEFRNQVRALLARVSEERLVPSDVSGEIDIAMLDRTFDDDMLDHYWTHRSLGDVQSIVARLRALRPIALDRLPDSKVQHYMEQASTAYVYGLFDACSILCRATLEFALKEKLACAATLDQLIDQAVEARIIDVGLKRQAERIQRRGNQTVHGNRCDPSDALIQVRESIEFLRHLYAM